jgi:hypothetical protein
MSSDKPNERRVTLGKIIAYPTGALLLLSGLGGLLAGNPLGGALILLAGIIALPVVRAKLKDSRGISLSRWATIGIVFIFVIGGGGIISGNADDTPEADNTESISQESVEETSTSEPEAGTLIQGPPETLLPTIEEFDTGWTAYPGEDPREISFFNFESETELIYNVTVHDSVQEAQSDLQNRRPVNVATDSVSIGDEGFLYKYDARYVIIQFQVENTVGQVTFFGGPGVLTPESNAVSFARRFEDAITD